MNFLNFVTSVEGLPLQFADIFLQHLRSPFSKLSFIFEKDELVRIKRQFYLEGERELLTESYSAIQKSLPEQFDGTLPLLALHNVIDEGDVQHWRNQIHSNIKFCL